MAWWNHLFKRKTKSPIAGVEYRVAFNLYSEDGKRGVEVHELRNGQAYFVEQEWVEGTTVRNRRPVEMKGPFVSPEDAERAAVATPWFCGREA